MENFVFCIDKKSRLFDGGGCDWKYYCFENISTLGKKHIFFMLEYPQIITEKVQCLTRLQRLENKSLENQILLLRMINGTSNFY